MELNNYLRKPLSVQAVQVNADNILEVMEWCNGTPVVNEAGVIHAIKVDILHPMKRSPNEANFTDWILKSAAGFKVFSDTAFKKTFILAEKHPIKQLVKVEASSDALMFTTGGN